MNAKMVDQNGTTATEALAAGKRASEAGLDMNAAMDQIQQAASLSAAGAAELKRRVLALGRG